MLATRLSSDRQPHFDDSSGEGLPRGLDDTVNARIRVNLLAQDRNVIVGQHGCIESVDAFPRRASCVCTWAT